MDGRAAVVSAVWRNLAIVNFRASPDVLEPYLPAGTELDYFGGETFLSMVGFAFLNTRVFGVPAIGHGSFPEVNLRFYVTRREGDQLRRGVVFIREIAPRRLVSAVARLAYHEHYVTLPMRAAPRLRDRTLEVGERVQYAWKLGAAWSRIQMRKAAPERLPAGDSFEHYILEHYWGYTRRRDGRTHEYAVAHVPWQVAPIVDLDCRFDAAPLYGPRLARCLQDPHSAFLADGSRVTVSRGVLLKASRSLQTALGERT